MGAMTTMGLLPRGVLLVGATISVYCSDDEMLDDTSFVWGSIKGNLCAEMN